MYNKGNIIKETYRYQLTCGSKPSEFSHKLRSGLHCCMARSGREKKTTITKCWSVPGKGGQKVQTWSYKISMSWRCTEWRLKLKTLYCFFKSC